MTGQLSSAWAALLGTMLGLGLYAVVSALPRFRRPSLVERLASSLTDVSAEARRMVADAEARAAGGGLGALRRAVVAAVDRRLGGGASIGRRLRQAGLRMPAERFRIVQLACAAAGLALGALVSAGVAITRPVPVPVSVCALLAVMGAVTGLLAADRVLSRLATRRLARIAEEFPTIAELLALSLSAGEGVRDGVRRVARAGSGALGRELRGVVADTAVGVPLVQALERLAQLLELPAFSRFVDVVASALEHGAPLAEVLRAQASDARAARKRELLEAAGRKEVAMLVPLVFLLLPLTVLIAVFPAAIVLRAGL